MELNGRSVLIMFVGFVGFYVIVTLIAVMPSLLERRKRLSERDRIETRFFPRATIAYDLVPKLKPFLAKRPTLYVTGADGHPLTTAKRYPWPGFIKDALACGCEVHYLLTDVSERDERLLLNAKEKFEHGQSGKLHLYFLSAERVAEQDKDLVDSLRTFHIVLIETADERMMWTEHYHPPRSTVAYGCEFTAPADAKDNKRYDEYKTALVHLTERYEARRSAPLAA